MKMSDFVKIVTFAPVIAAEKVRQAVGDAGAGKKGNYSHASFTSKGIGRFKPLAGAHPCIGQVGELEEVEEERIEVICEKAKVKEVVAAIKRTHPYEEIPIEIWPIFCE